ncbi:oligosaccharide flippase family protein [Vibrio harveyi]|uniref:oligosaccharide flippase family protein n=1 Tax=Vibrio harveyi TaxID=669 RepID=UPI0040676001|nr:oligosaccharide flippase family protein [Vibrio harveyi]
MDKKLWENFSYLTVIQVLLVAMPLFYYPYVVRILGTDGYGEVVLSQAIVGFFSIFINFGFTISATKSASINRNDTIKLSEIFSCVFYSKLIFLVVSFFILFVILGVFGNLGVDNKLLYIAFITCVSDVFLIQWFYQGIEKMKLVALSNLFAKFFSLIFIFLLIRDGDDGDVLLYILSLSLVFSNLVMFLYPFLKYKIVLTPFDYNKIIETIKESSLFFTSRVSVVFIEKLNITLLGTYTNTHFVSVYDLANKFVSLIQLPINMLNQALYPRVSNTKNIKLVINVIKYCLIIAIPVGVFIYWIIPYIIGIYAGSEFSDSTIVFYILGFNIIINIISHFFGNCILVVMGYAKEFNYSILYSSLLYALSLSVCIYLDVFDVYVSAALIVFFNFSVMAFRLFFASKAKVC